MAGYPNFWTDEKVEELKRLNEANLTAAQVGAEMGITRNAVLGKLYRMGLCGNTNHLTDEERALRKKMKNERDARNTYFRRHSVKGKNVQEPTIPTAAPIFEGSLNIPFADLRDRRHDAPNQCRYIADEPPGPNYLACGNETPAGESYCAHCKQITLANYGNSPAERAQHIQMGVRNHLRSMRKVA